MRFSRAWFWPVGVALLVVLPALVPGASRPVKARWLIAGGLAGLAAVVAQGWFIGVRGWSYAWLDAAFGMLDERQFGIGLGGSLASSRSC